MKTVSTICRYAVLRFLRQSKGVVVIEAAFALLAFVTIIAIAVDLGSAFIQQSRLERATYTAASVFRERIALYADPIENNANRPITQAEVNQLQRIVQQLLDRDDIVVRVDELTFQPVPANINNPVAPIVLDTRDLTAPFGSTCQTTLDPIGTYAHLSPWSSRRRWLPLYRVTVCIPGERSWFRNIVNSNHGSGLTVQELIAFNIVIPR